MMSVQLVVGLLGLLAAAAAYAVVTGLVLSSHRSNPRAAWLLRALAISCLWAASIAAVVWIKGMNAVWLVNLDAVHALVWALFLSSMLGASGRAWMGWSPGRLLAVGSVALAALVFVSGGPFLNLSAIGFDYEAKLLAMLGPPLLGLLGLEQLFRNADFEKRRILRPLVIGVGAVFAIDLVVYSQAVLFAEISTGLWASRGFVNAAAAPLILLTIKRDPAWERELFVSRQVVFYTTTLVGAGAYLLAMAAGGFLIGTVEGVWGLLLQTMFIVGGACVFLYALFSASIRRQLKVFIAKHFYRNQYDYREEWLRLVRTLAASDDEGSLAERCVKALAAIVGSRGGEQWLASEPQAAYESYGAWGVQSSGQTLLRTDPLVQFLDRTHWIVDSAEYARDPERYMNAFADAESCLPTPCIIVPLVHDQILIGIVRLERPAELNSLTFEDHDLLKTAGQQVAIFLAQERSQERLSQTRQLEAFTKLTAFLMHDLKNLIAQQELVVGNARRFKHRPEFVDDAVRTIETGVQRMKRVLERLAGAGTSEWTARIDPVKLLEDVCTSCADRLPIPVITRAVAGLHVEMDRDRLIQAVTHAVRNAQDATPTDGCIELRLLGEGTTALIEVVDTGSGMDEAFIRDRLFKPFVSTKGVKGMGIGAYQIRETLRAAGGDVEVSSVVGEGTTFRMKLPVLRDAAKVSAQSAA